MESPEAPVLEMRGIAASYGARRVLSDFNLTAGSRELVAVVGHNGAGKTTALRIASGLKSPSKGQVLIGGQPAGRSSASSRARAGMGMVPEGVAGLFPTLTVRQNLDAVNAFSGSTDDAGWESILTEIQTVFQDVLVKRRDQIAGSLSGGQRQMLAISLALVRRPTVLLLDEPSTGLAPTVVERIFHVVEQLTKQTSTAVVLVEQNLADALRVASRVVVVQSGQAVAQFHRGEFPSATELWKFF